MGGVRMLNYSVYTVIVATCVYFVDTWPVSLVGLTRSQHAAIAELRDRVRNDLPHRYMEEDVYLLRWLTAKNFDVNQAETLLRENLNWRSTQHMDKILNEDWSRFEVDYPYQLDTFDKMGRPILYFSFGEWDIRKLGVAGMLPQLNRYFAKMFEDADSKVRAIRAQGNNITQFNMIMNLEGYSIAQHACIQCLPFYTTLTQTLEAHFPGTAERVLMVNSPTVFELVLRLISGVLSKQARDTMQIYGTDRKTWEPVLLQFIDRDQFPGDL